MRNATDHFVYTNFAPRQLVVEITSKLATTAGCVIHVGGNR